MTNTTTIVAPTYPHPDHVAWATTMTALLHAGLDWLQWIDDDDVVPDPRGLSAALGTTMAVLGDGAAWPVYDRMSLFINCSGSAAAHSANYWRTALCIGAGILPNEPAAWTEVRLTTTTRSKIVRVAGAS